MPDRKYVDFKKLKARISMRDLLDHYELTETMEAKDETTLIGRCPITESNSDTAFKVNTAKDVWYSFALEGDGAGGNILDFVARMEETDIVGAANLIDDWFDDEPDHPDENEDTNDRDAEHPQTEHSDAYDALVQLSEDEVAILQSGARSEIEDLLDDLETPGDEQGREEVAERLSRWILRAYQRGYKLGKMQGRIDERISDLA